MCSSAGNVLYVLSDNLLLSSTVELEVETRVTLSCVSVLYGVSTPNTWILKLDVQSPQGDIRELATVTTEGMRWGS